MSQDLNPLPEDLAGVERALGALKPAPTALNRDQLMYEAGRAAACHSVHTRLRVWQGTCAVLLVGCAALALFPREKIVERQIAIQPKPQPAQISPRPEIAISAATPTPVFPPLLWPSINLVRRSVDATQGIMSQESNLMGTSSAGAARYPTLHRGEGLDTLPNWQQKQIIFGGNRS